MEDDELMAQLEADLGVSLCMILSTRVGLCVTLTPTYTVIPTLQVTLDRSAYVEPEYKAGPKPEQAQNICYGDDLQGGATLCYGMGIAGFVILVRK